MGKVADPQALLHNRAGGTAKNKSHRNKEYHAAGSDAGVGCIPPKEQAHHSDGRDIEALGQEKQEQAACESHVIQEMKDDHADGKGRHEADTIRNEADEYGKRRSLLLDPGQFPGHAQPGYHTDGGKGKEHGRKEKEESLDFPIVGCRNLVD